MARLDSLKRRMILDLAEENLADIEGRAPGRPSESRRSALSIGLAALVAPLVAALAVLAQAGPGLDSPVARVAAGGGEPVVHVEATERFRPAPLRSSKVRPNGVTRSAGEEALFPAPVPLDASVFPLPIRTVVLDPGHGGESNVGTVASSGLTEKDLTLDIALRLRSLLTQAGYRVLMTRDDDREVSLEDRTRFANQEQADIFVSIHVNWLGEAARGIETFFLGPTEDPYLTHLASRENRDSGYSLAALREILEGVYANLRQEESRRLAVAVQAELHAHLSEVAPAIVDRGVKTAPFVVLVGTEMPAILAEVSALSSQEEARLLELPAYRQYIALAIFSGICSYAGGTDEPEYQAS